MFGTIVGRAGVLQSSIYRRPWYGLFLKGGGNGDERFISS